MADLAERFSNALHSTARASRLAMDRRLKGLGVSQAGWMTIAAVAKAQRPLSQSDLAEHLGVEGATMVSMIDRLVKAGLVLREPSTEDRRVKRVLLTEAGNRAFEQVKTEAAALRKELLAGIQPEKLESATELLEQLQGMFDAGS
jgi:MarR family transcriptional regulator, transcriptional regulator for hemolysin